MYVSFSCDQRGDFVRDHFISKFALNYNYVPRESSKELLFSEIERVHVSGGSGCAAVVEIK